MGFDESVLDGLDAGLDGAVGIGVNAAMTEAFVGVAESHKRGDMDAAREGVGKVLAWCAHYYFFLPSLVKERDHPEPVAGLLSMHAGRVGDQGHPLGEP